MKWLITTDIHLSSRPKDEYRFGLFDWLLKQQKKYEVDATFILGDITQEKDNHSSALVNRTIAELMKLTPPVYILRGNHDGIDPNNPFFKFLSCIEGLYFIVKPKYLLDLNVALIPHCRDQAELDAACAKVGCPGAYFMAHQTFEGAIAETGARLSGLSASPIELLKPRAVWSGDVHKPQQCGPVTYVGAPFHVRFGDNFEPRVLLIENGKEQNLYFDCPRKWTLHVKDSDSIKNHKALRSWDQVKLIVEMAREDVVEWAAHKSRILAACKARGLEVYGIDLVVNSNTTRKADKTIQTGRSNKEILTSFCQAENTPSAIKKVGLAILENE